MLQVLEVVLAFHFHIMDCDDVLFFLLPIEFFSFKVPDIFNFVTLLLESVVSLVVDCLDI